MGEETIQHDEPPSKSSTDPVEDARSADWKESISHVLRERAFFYIILVLLVLLTLLLLFPFLSAILLGLAAVVITKPVYDWFMKKKWLRESTKWSVAMTIVTVLLLIAIPVITFIGVAISQARSLLNNLTDPFGDFSIDSAHQSISELIAYLSSGDIGGITRTDITNWRQSVTDDLISWLGDIVIAIGTTIPSFMINSVIVLAIMMVLLPLYRQPNRSSIAEIIPFPPMITTLYLDKVQVMIRSMFLGTFVIAIVQGAAMGVVYWIAGVPNTVFLAMISMLLALLPVIGVSLLAWPIAILLFLAGSYWQAVFIIVMLIVVVGNIDTILRPMLVPKDAYLNPALTLLSVFGGLKLLGLVGLLYGPVIMILLVTSIEVYSKYILRSDLEPYLDNEGTLSLEKLGLKSEEGDLEGTGTSISSMVSKSLGKLWTRPNLVDTDE